MTGEFKTLWELNQEGVFKDFYEHFVDSLRTSINVQTIQLSNGTVSEQMIIGIIFLPFGATEGSIKACQINTNQKLIKLGGAVIIAMTSLSAILFLEILELSQPLINIY